jgi:hypothetical protein
MALKPFSRFCSRNWGIETSSEFLANAFVAAGHEVRLMTTTRDEAEDFPYPIIRTTSPLEMIQHHA